MEEHRGARLHMKSLDEFEKEERWSDCDKHPDDLCFMFRCPCGTFDRDCERKV